jgi:hypothetical protein
VASGGSAKVAEPPEAAAPDGLAPLAVEVVLEPPPELQAAIARAAAPSAATAAGVERDADLNGFLMVLLTGHRAGVGRRFAELKSKVTPKSKIVNEYSK